MTAGEWLTSQGAADYSAMSVHTIRNAAERGDLAGIKTTPGEPHSQWRFKRSEVDEWLERGRVPHVPSRRRRTSLASVTERSA